jgi:hypothetical protein
MHKWKQLTLTGFTIAGICLLAGCTTTVDGKSENTLERAVDQPLDDAASAVKNDYRNADEQHEDIIDKAFAPLDDTVDTINRDLNREDADSAPTETDD